IIFHQFSTFLCLLFEGQQKTAIISFLKGKFFLSLRLFLYFCNKILKISVPDSWGMLYYEQSRIIKTRKNDEKNDFPYTESCLEYFPICSKQRCDLSGA
ncbi:hypothetical protein, partial [Segatella copri]